MKKGNDSKNIFMKSKLKEKVKTINNFNSTFRKKKGKNTKKITETKTNIVRNEIKNKQLEEPGKIKINFPIKENNELINNLNDKNLVEQNNEYKNENYKNRLKTKSNKIFNNIRSDYILKYIFEFLTEKRSLKIIRYNKELLERLEITINDYKKYKNRIEIKIIPIKELKEEKNIFININENKILYHIYFNDYRKEEKRNYITPKDKVTKIRIILERGIKSFEELFKDCTCIKSIYFIKYQRNDIINMRKMFYNCSSLLFLDLSNLITYNVTNMSYMFFECKSLMELDIINFKTYNVYDMSNMFYGCQSLTDLNLFNFDTSKVRNMWRMFFGCKLLKFLNISNFNTFNVTNMSHMFFGCQSLKTLNVSNFNTFNVTNMSYMFYGCQSLRYIDVSNFKINFVRDLSGMFLWCKSLRNINISNFIFHDLAEMNLMFFGCSKELQIQVKEQNKNIKDKAFEEL